MLGNKTLLDFESWPQFDPKLIEEDEFELIIQVNGRVRGIVRARRGITPKEAKILVGSQDSTQKWLAGKKIKKTIFVKDRLVNFVI